MTAAVYIAHTGAFWSVIIDWRHNYLTRLGFTSEVEARQFACAVCWSLGRRPVTKA